MGLFPTTIAPLIVITGNLGQVFYLALYNSSVKFDKAGKWEISKA